MSVRSCDLSGKCGACRRIVKQGVFCIECKLWFHWDCAATNSDSVSQVWFCELCRCKALVSSHENTILGLRKELELARSEIESLKLASKNRSKSPEFKVYSNTKRRRSFGCSRDKIPELELSNRFSALTVAEVGSSLALPEEVPTAPSLETGSALRSKPGKESSDAKRRVLVVGSSHARGIRERLQAKLGEEYTVTSIFNPNAGLSHVAGNVRDFAKDLNKEDHVVIVGGPGNSLDRNLNYTIEMDMDHIAKASSHTNVSFVNLFWRYDKPWINRRVRAVNQRLDQFLDREGTSHIRIVDVSSMEEYGYTRHGLHLNSRGKDMLSHSIAKGISCTHMDSPRNIPALVSSDDTPFLG